MSLLQAVATSIERDERRCTIAHHIVRQHVVLREARVVLQDVRKVWVLGPRSTFVVRHSFQEVVRILAWFCLACSAVCKVHRFVAGRVDKIVRELVASTASQVEYRVQVGKRVAVNQKGRDLVVEIYSVRREPPIREDRSDGVKNVACDPIASIRPVTPRVERTALTQRNQVSDDMRKDE